MRVLLLLMVASVAAVRSGVRRSLNVADEAEVAVAPADAVADAPAEVPTEVPTEAPTEAPADATEVDFLAASSAASSAAVSAGGPHVNSACKAVAGSTTRLPPKQAGQLGAEAACSGTKADDKIMRVDAAGKSLCAACVKHVDKIHVGTAGGCLAMTSLPGRRGTGNSGPPPFQWARSAAEDAAALREVHKVDGVVTLLEDEELAVYGVDGDNDLFEAFAAAALHTLHCPVHDFSTVGHATWRKVIGEGLPLLADIRKGKCIAVHCAGGHGRTGTMVAQLLMALADETPELKSLSLEDKRVAIINKVRAARADTIETFEQEMSVAWGYMLRTNVSQHSEKGNTNGPPPSAPYPAA